MNTIRHLKGQHFSIMPTLAIRFNAKTVTKKYSFTDSCKYNFNDENQFDWNKLTGVSFNLLNARIDSIMCGWRYNTIEDSFELCGYYHVNSSFNPPTIPLCSVKSNESFEVKFTFDKQSKEAIITIYTLNGIFTDKTTFNKFGINRDINTWFGGTKPAPNNMTIIIN
jgi:hypothetical protein